MTTAAEKAALARDEDEDGYLRCRRCGVAVRGPDGVALRQYSKHHRKLRRHADADRVENIVVLCGSGTTGDHGWVHAHPKEAYEEGWMCRSWERPDVVLCLTQLDTTIRFLSDGSELVTARGHL